MRRACTALMLLAVVAAIGVSVDASAASRFGATTPAPSAKTPRLLNDADPILGCFQNHSACIQNAVAPAQPGTQGGPVAASLQQGSTSVVTTGNQTQVPTATGAAPRLPARVVCNAARTTCTTYKNGQKFSVCVVRNGVKTCTYYRNGGAYKRCKTRNRRTTCLQFAVRQGASATTAADISWQWAGFPQSAMTAVGQLIAIYPAGSDGKNPISTCTATVVTNGLLVTSAHCIYNPELAEVPIAMGFSPSQTWNDASDPNSLQTPYGIWKADGWWVPTGFESGDWGLDWGVVEIPAGGCIQSCPANANGQWIGAITGEWSMTAGLQYNIGSPLWVTGYPGAGFWETAAGFNGRGQYACNTTYAGYEPRDSGYDILAGCPMNQGASGGPWFAQLSDGSWTIGATSSFCSGGGVANGLSCQPYGTGMKGLYFDNNFLSFWHSVPPNAP